MYRAVSKLWEENRASHNPCESAALEESQYRHLEELPYGRHGVRRPEPTASRHQLEPDEDYSRVEAFSADQPGRAKETKAGYALSLRHSSMNAGRNAFQSATAP